jgi:hypothetical protein
MPLSSTLAAIALAFAPTQESLPASPDDPYAIVGGNLAAECQFPSVVSMLWGHENTLCSGTLIHPQVVLTAAHCVTAEVEIDSVAFGETTATSGGMPEFMVDTVQCVAHPGWLESEVNDVAYCVLAWPVDFPVIPLAAGCEIEALAPGQEVVIVGFGATYGSVDDMGEVNFTEGVGTKRYTTQVIDHIDYGVGTVNLTGPNGSQSACFGDSGGPGLVRLSDGTWRTFGAASQLFDPGGLPPPQEPGNVCGPGVTYGHAGLVLDWLESTSGLDLTPCWNGDVFVAGPGCDAFPQEVHHAIGSWGSGCWGGSELGAMGVCEGFAGPFDPEPSIPDPGTNPPEPPPPEPPTPEPPPPEPPPPMPPPPEPVPPMPPPMDPGPPVDPEAGSDDGFQTGGTDTDPELAGDGFVGRGCSQSDAPRSAWMLLGLLALARTRRRAGVVHARSCPGTAAHAAQRPLRGGAGSLSRGPLLARVNQLWRRVAGNRSVRRRPTSRGRRRDRGR